MAWIEYVLASREVLREMMEDDIRVAVQKAAHILIEAARNNQPILICGNGGSAADASHLAAELMGRFRKDRPPVKAISLAADAAFLTAYSNDMNYHDVFIRQIEAYNEGVLVAITTSGKSSNVLRAINMAKEKGMKVIALTGKNGIGPLWEPTVQIKVPCSSTPLIQQAHQVVYHWLAEQVEDAIA